MDDPVTSRQIQISGYREGDEEQILNLFRKTFSRTRSRRHWEWKHRKNPFGNLMISLAFSTRGELLAHYGGYPVKLFRQMGERHERLPAVHIGDMMTDRKVRRLVKGHSSILTLTARHFFGRWSEGKVAVNYGVNTGHSLEFCLRFLGGKFVERIVLWTRNLERPVLSQARGWTFPARGYRFEQVVRFDERWDRFFLDVAPAYGFLIERDSRYLNWRYDDPEISYFTYALSRRQDLVGWGVFRQLGDRLVWGDGLFSPRALHTLPYFLTRVIAAEPHRESRCVESWFPKRPAWFVETLEAMGFESHPDPDGLSLIYAPFLQDPAHDYRERYYYTRGDADLF